MKFTVPIEVSGIKVIIIDRSPHMRWTRTAGSWWRQGLRRVKDGHEMSQYVRRLLSDSRRRAWVHGDTLNIVRREDGDPSWTHMMEANDR